jgi:helical/beta-bridge protein
MNRFCAERLQSLVRTLELNRLDEYSSLQKVANFATLVSTYERGINVPIVDRSNNKFGLQASFSF